MTGYVTPYLLRPIRTEAEVIRLRERDPVWYAAACERRDARKLAQEDLIMARLRETQRKG